MEQQIEQVKELLNRLPKSVLIELLLAQDPTEQAPKHVPVRKTSNAPISRRRWTQAQDDALIYAVKQGRQTYTEIALRLGRTPEGIHNRLAKLRKAGLV